MKFYAWSPWILQTLVWIPTRITLRFFVHLQVKGLEHVLKLPPGIAFALNHSSELDPILLPASFPFLSRFCPTFYTSREPEFYKRSGWRQHFYGGTFFKAWGAYPVFVGKHNYDVSLSHHIGFLNDRSSLCIFPEGQKTRDGKVQEGKGGVTYLAWKTNVPIVPVYIRGAFEMTLADFFFRRRKITVSFSQPIFPAELFPTAPTLSTAHDDFKVATQKVMSVLKGFENNLNTHTVKATDYIGKMVSVKIDRPLNSKHPKFNWEYKLNYGFIPETNSQDGEELDAYIVGVDQPVESFKGKCVAVIHRTNDDDDKLVVVPPDSDPSDDEIRVSTNFQEQFFKSEIIRV